MWLGVFFLSLSWCFFLPTFTLVNYWGGIAYLALGVLLISYGLRSIEIKTLSEKYLFSLVPLILFSLFLPMPYKIGAILQISGLLLLFFNRSLILTRRLGFGLCASGFLFLFQAVLITIYSFFAARNHDIPMFGPVYSLLSSLAQLPTSYNDGKLVISHTLKTMFMPPTFEGVLPYPSIALLGTILLISLIWFPKAKNLFFLTGMWIFYLLARYVYMLFIVYEQTRMDWFWTPLGLSITFFPLIVLCLLFYPISIEPVPLSIQWRRNNRNLIFWGSMVFVGTWALLAFLGFVDPGQPKNGRVLIDEKHSQWSMSTREMDTEWFGQESVYNYYSLRKYLDNYFQVSFFTEGSITQELLKNVDVLIIKVPTEPLTQAEIDTVSEFVHQGGGLWLIGDHTNLYGSTTYLNPLAERFGIWFNEDATYNLEGNFTNWHSSKVLAHPIVRQMSDFVFATSCSLYVPISKRSIITGYGIRTVDADYSDARFFASGVRVETDSRFGLFIQCAAIQKGKGRVLAFTDSTVFSNFCLFHPGKSELALSSVDWLNRKNKYGWLRNLFIGIALVLLGAASLYLLFQRKGEAFLIGYLCVLLALPTGVKLIDYFYLKAYPPPKSHQKFVQVCLEAEFSKGSAFPKAAFQPLAQSQSDDYTTFFVGIQRLGFIPAYKKSLAEALVVGDIVVMINPSKQVHPQHIKHLLEYVKSGGKLLLLSGIDNVPIAPANQVLKPFGISIGLPIPSNYLCDGKGKPIAKAKCPHVIQGGEPLLFSEGGLPVLSKVNYGKGMVMCMSDSSVFSIQSMGSLMDEPTNEQLQINQLEFWIFQQLWKE